MGREARLEGGKPRQVEISRANALSAAALQDYRQGDYAAAQPLMLDALNILRRLKGDRDPNTLTFMDNYATILRLLDRLDEAEPLAREAYQLRRKVLGENNHDTITSMANYALVLVNQGQFDQVEPVLADALRLSRKVLGAKAPDTLTIMAQYGDVLRRLERLDEAAALLEQAVMLNREVRGNEDPATIDSIEGEARLLSDLGRAKEAEPLFAEALRLNRAVRGEQHPDTIASLADYASDLVNLGRSDQAAPLLAEVLRLNRVWFGNKHVTTIASLNNYATALLKLDRAGEAEQLISEALDSLRSSHGDHHPDTLIAAENLSLARLRVPAKQDLALEPIELVMTDVAAQAVRHHAEDEWANRQANRDFGNSRLLEVFADAAWARLSVKAGDPLVAALTLDQATQLGERAFMALQTSMIDATTRAMGRSTAKRAAERAGVASEVFFRQNLIAMRQAEDIIGAQTYGESDAHSDETLAVLHASAPVEDAKLAKIEAAIKAKAPDYFELIAPQPLTVVRAKSLLAPEEAALMLIPTEFGTQILVVTHESLTWRHSTLTSLEIDKLVRRLLWDVGGTVAITPPEEAQWSNEGEGASPYDFGTAYRLYRELIEPVGQALAGKKQLFVSSTGALSSIPLGILVTEIPRGPNGDPKVLRGAKWLADRYSISVIPSLQSLDFIRRYRETTAPPADRKPFVGFGDPLLNGIVIGQDRRGRSPGVRGGFHKAFTRGVGLGAISPLADVTELRSLPRLPATRTEIESQWAAFGSPANAKFLGADATETRVKHADLGAKVLSFATHGLLAGEIGGDAEPGLVFTPPATGSAADDGYLTASEIAGLHIDADWVILSACNTAAGDGSVGAPGLSGLSRSFFFAGATNLLVSHWPVRDEVAAKLTVRAIAIANGKPGTSRAEALQRAEREIRDDPSHDGPHDSWAHPSAWAPFSMVGDGAR